MSVVLPTYCEAGSIEAAVGSVLELVDGVQVVVVDDDSPDDTAAVVASSFGGDDRVRLIVRRDESGLASAVLRGIDVSDAPQIVVMDADLQHPPSAVPSLLAALEDGADLCIGSRHRASGGIDGDWPTHRRVISWIATGMARVAVPAARDVTDPMSGFFAVRREVVEAARDELRPSGYKILLELLARCPLSDVRERGYEFRERSDGGSNLGPREYLRYLRHLGRLSAPARRSSERLEDQRPTGDRS